jgi:universal stress protein A
MSAARGYRHVMAALDEAEAWHGVAEQALEVAQRYGARLTLLHVVDQRVLTAGGEADVPLFGLAGPQTEEQAERALTEPSPVPFSIDDRLMAQARSFLGAVVEHLGNGRIETLAVASSTIGHEIVATARRLSVDLLVCGTRDRHGLSLFMPSPVDGIVHHLPCDVLLVRLA